MRWATRGQIRGREQGQRRKIVDRVNGLEPGEAPPHVGGLACGCQGGSQIVLLCGVDLVAGKRVKIVDETDSCYVAEPWLPHVGARSRTHKRLRGHLGPKFRGQDRVVCVRGHDSNGRDQAVLA